ncbi:MAG: hypothetical protein K5798_10310 [Nitrosopumilus sp.]|uniref:hypothetical protein n=1 Tax=Nitrosopumilus sp. TaxID=2024843 RepID=UPI002431D66F|nr:hypothetical protein [Nitrosopumilus sp.]MCV0367637.1 hypothetical protein [Nitrosopumilus sp.]
MKTRLLIIIGIGSIVSLSTFFLVIYHDPNDKLPDQELTYEQFFREYVSTSCPIIEKPEDATSFDSENCKWIERDWYEGEQFEKIIRYCTDPKSNPAGETSSISKGGEIKLDSKNCTWLHGGFYNQVWVNQTADPVPLIQNGNVMSPEGKVIRSVK